VLDRGPDHARAKRPGQTALAAATFRRCPDAVTALLDAGADPALGRRSALATAAVFELPDMLELLQRRAGPETPQAHRASANSGPGSCPRGTGPSTGRCRGRTLRSPEVHHLLTAQRGWSGEEYERWLAEAFADALLVPSA
jgi:hypothetical protein